MMKMEAQRSSKGKGKGHLATGRSGLRGFGWVKAPDFLHVRHYKGGRSSALRIGCLYPWRNPWYSFSEAVSTPGHMVLPGATEKIPSDTTGNGSRNRPTSSVVHVPPKLRKIPTRLYDVTNQNPSL